MAKLLKLRRGDNTAHSSFTGAEGEVTVNTQKDTIVVHDGSTQGGFELARADLSNLPAGTIDNADISSSAAIANSKLATSGVSAGTYGSSSAIPAITVNDRGIVTAASTTAIDSTAIANGTTNVTANATDVDINVSGSEVATFGANGVQLRAQYDLRFNDADSSNWVGFQAPTTVGSNVTFTLPGADGSDRQALTTNGSNVLGWTNLPAVTSSSTAPANPKDNDLWYDTDDGRLYFRYNDGSSTQWVDASPEGGPGSNEFSSLRLNGSTSGWIQLEAPATAPNSTIVFPSTSGTNGAYLQTNGAGVTSWATISDSHLTRGTAQSLNSTTGVEFTGIANNARRISIVFNGASTTGNDIVFVRLGSGSLATSGYSATYSFNNGSSVGTGDSTIGIPLANGDATYEYYGAVTLTNIENNRWIGSGVLLGDRTGNAILNSAGWINLGGTLDRVGCACNAGSFDAGNVNIIVETD